MMVIYVLALKKETTADVRQGISNDSFCFAVARELRNESQVGIYHAMGHV
jgi:hypothetical protein